MSRRLSEEDIRGILQMHSDGISMANIAKEYGCSVNTVFRHISSVNGVKQMRSFTLEQKQSAVNDWLSGRYTIRQVATSHGIGISTLEKWTRLHKAGKLGDVPARRMGPPRKVSDDILAEAVELYNNGKGIRSIAEHIGVYPDTIKKNLIKVGVYKGAKRMCSTKGRKDKFSDETKKCILSDYTDGTMTIPKLGEKYGASAPTITRILKSFGVQHESTGRKGIAQDGTRYDIEQVISDYKTGEYTHKTLAEKYGVSTRTISRILDSAGVEAIGGKRLASATEVAEKMGEVVSLADKGKGVFDIAEDTGLSVGTVKHILGADKRCSRHDEVALLHSQGLAVKDIASEVGVSEPTVRKILSSAGDADGINQKNL